MNISGFLQVLLAVGFVLFSVTVTTVESLRCFICDTVASNEDCNLFVAECTDPEHDGCFNTVEKYESFGKMYSKGCTNHKSCKRLQDLNDGAYCSRYPSKCTYCCDSTKCNENNAAYSWCSVNWILLAGVLASSVLTNSHILLEQLGLL